MFLTNNLILSRRKARCRMRYFIDHENRKIHIRIYAGDRCGFNDTPPEKREFTSSDPYITDLEKNRSYQKCIHCEGVSISPVNEKKVSQ